MHLNVVPEIFQLLVDMELEFPWVFAHPLELDEERPTPWDPEESIRVSYPSPHV